MIASFGIGLAIGLAVALVVWLVWLVVGFFRDQSNRLPLRQYTRAYAAQVKNRRGHNDRDLHCAYWSPQYSATSLDRCPICNPERKP